MRELLARDEDSASPRISSIVSPQKLLTFPPTTTGKVQIQVLLHPEEDLMKFLKDELKLEGHFWICSSPDHKVSGWLVIEEDKVELVYWTALHRPRYLDFPEDSSCRILGELKGRGPITLDGCYHMGNPIPFPPKQFTDAAIKDKLENATNIDEYLEAINIPVYVSDRRVHVGRVFFKSIPTIPS